MLLVKTVVGSPEFWVTSRACNPLKYTIQESGPTGKELVDEEVVIPRFNELNEIAEE